MRVTLGGKRHELRAKVLAQGALASRVKVEHDDAARVAVEAGLPLWQVVQAAQDAVARKAKGGRRT